MTVLVIAYALLVGLLLWALAGITDVRRGARATFSASVAIVGAAVIAFALYDALASTSGWPTRERPPAQALLLYGTAVEPGGGDAGAIWLWLVPLDRGGPLGYQAAADDPRAYRLPYSRRLHEALRRALSASKAGKPVLLVRGRRGRRNGSQRRTGGYYFRRLPAPRQQPKTP